MSKNIISWYESISEIKWERMIVEHIKRELKISHIEAEKKYKELSNGGIFDGNSNLRTDCCGRDEQGNFYYSIRLGIIRALKSMGYPLFSDI